MRKLDEKRFWKSEVLRKDDDTDVQAIVLLDEHGRDCEVLIIHLDGDTVVFTEQCDSWNDARLTKPQAIAALKQAIEWIENGFREQP